VSILIDLALAVLLLSLSALFSGLTIGLFSLDTNELRRKMELGNKQATKLYPIRAKGSQLLVTLILGNVLVNSALTVVLNSITAGIIAIVISTILITTFGEVLPAAYLDKHGMRFGARLSPQINIVMKYSGWITEPVGKFLDKTIGDKGNKVYTKKELLKLMDDHEGMTSDIEDEDLSIAKHALSFADKHIADVMLPRDEMIALKETDILSPELLNQLHASPDSAFPVYRATKDNIVGTLYLRDLVNLDKSSNRVEQIMDADVFYVKGDQKVDHALSAFLHTKHHIFVVVDERGKTLGIVTIEDIIDEVMGRKFMDKFDKHEDKKAVAAIAGEAE